jgi:hypothetical protein
MRGITLLLLTAVATVGYMTNAPRAQAQVSVRIGPAPDCPYGYYNVAPYDCAPAGYYGSEWFNGGVFVGVGPWFHGPHDFHGRVDNHFRPDHGYHGPFPKHGEKPEPGRRVDNAHFHGNETRDGRGHASGDKR